MEYPLQDFDGSGYETEYLLQNNSSHGSDMDVQIARNNRNPKRKQRFLSVLCR